MKKYIKDLLERFRLWFEKDKPSIVVLSVSITPCVVKRVERKKRNETHFLY